MPLPFSVIEAFLGVVAAVLAVYLWRVRLLRSMELHCPSERGRSPGSSSGLLQAWSSRFLEGLQALRIVCRWVQESAGMLWNRLCRLTELV